MKKSQNKLHTDYECFSNVGVNTWFVVVLFSVVPSPFLAILSSESLVHEQSPQSRHNTWL